jgi:hypothetical protein
MIFYILRSDLVPPQTAKQSSVDVVVHGPSVTIFLTVDKRSTRSIELARKPKAYLVDNVIILL